MALYIGYLRPTQTFIEENQNRARGGGSPQSPAMGQKIREFPDKLPASCTLHGTFSPILSGNALGDWGFPGVTIVETDNPEDLEFINTHYAGYLMFTWVPGRALGTTAQSRKA